MKHFTTELTSTERHTPTDEYPNRARSQRTPEELAGYGRRVRGRRLAQPTGVPRDRVTVKMYPNGEFTLGFMAIEKKRADDSRYDWGQVGEVMGTSPEPDEVDTTLGSIAVPHEERVYSPLNLAVVQNHHTSSVAYGLKGITTYGKRTIRNIGFLMEEEFGKESLSMGTLTIPQFTNEVMKAICSNWGYLVRTFFQEMKRIYAREGLTFRYCSVTEIQPQRWKNHKQVGLHIHFLWIPVWVDWAQQYLISYNDIRGLWQRLLQNVVNRCFSNGADVPTVPNPNFRDERVKKDASAYMAKYMSKGSDIVQEVINEKGEEWIPAQWWSADKTSKAILKSRIESPSGEAKRFLMDICESYCEHYLAYAHEIFIERPGYMPLSLGFTARLSPAGKLQYALIRGF